MRRLLVVALLLAGLCAPPAVLAQIGSPPGIGSPPFSTASPTFTGTALFGSGTCASAGVVPFTGGVPSISFTADTDSGLCWDTAGGSAAAIGIALIKDGRQLGRFTRTGGSLFGHNTGGTLKGQALQWDVLGGSLYGWDVAGAAERLIAGWSYQTGVTPTPGAITLVDNVSLAYQGTTLDANLTYITVTNPTASRQFNIPDFSGTALVSSTANEPDTGNAVWANTGSLLFEGPTANAFETELDVVEPTADRVIYLPDASGNVLLGGDTANTVGELGVSPHMSLTATGSYFNAQVYETAQINTSSITVGSSPGSREVALFSQETGKSAIFRVNPSGGSLTAWDTENVTYIEGGFSIDGTTVSNPVSTVKVTVVDTTASITDGDIQVCGAKTAEDSGLGIISCNTLDFAGGAGNLTTADTFIYITNIKASSFVGLGGGGDETIAVEFTTDSVSILSATNLVNHTKSTYPFGYTPAKNLVSYKCLDLQGCTLDLATAPSGTEAVTIMLVNGTTALSAADSATMKVSASHSLDAYDSISFVYSRADALWVQTSVSAN